MDSYPDQPNNILEDLVRKFKMNQQRFVYYTAIKLDSSTDKMFNMMKEAFGKNFIITEKVDKLTFCKTMMDTMTASIEDS